MTNLAKLKDAISLVEKIEKLTLQIYDKNKSQFEGNEDLQKEFASFFKLVTFTLERLKNPVLSIAMIGTTSAGKSTIVNALSGRRIAPMEIKETSAGILRLVPEDLVSMEVKRVPQGYWESGCFKPITDEQAYDKIKVIYEKYRRFEKVVMAPEITVRGPLLWHTHPELLNLPENLSVEFIDLPGLKTLTDNKNLKVIQGALSKSLCIIAIDSGDVDETRIEFLLEELANIVKSMSGNTDSLLFLLNKVDNLKKEDDPLGLVMERLKDRIVKSLKLNKDTQVEIIPFVGLLLYWAQLSIGDELHTSNFVKYDQDCLNSLFSDCANIFEKENVMSPDEYDLVQEIKVMSKRKADIPLEKLKQFISICFRLSHGEELFIELKRRIAESFSAVIIRPAVNDLLKSLDLLITNLTLYINIKQKGSNLDLQSEKLGVVNARLFLSGTDKDDNYQSIKKSLLEIKKDINEISISDSNIDELEVKRRKLADIGKIYQKIEEKKSGFVDEQFEEIKRSTEDIACSLKDLKDEFKITSYFKSIKDTNRSVDVFNGISEIPKLIAKKLDVQVLEPFRRNLERNNSKGLFIKELSKNLPISLVQPLAAHYEMMRQLFFTSFASYKKESEYYVNVTRVEMSKQWVENVQKIYKSLDVRMRDILSHKTNFLFQLETNQFTNVLKEYIQKEMKYILDELKKKANTHEIDLSELIGSVLNVEEMDIEMPDSLFAFSTPGEFVPDKSKVWLKNEITGYKRHSCSSDDPIYTSVYGDEYSYKFDNSTRIYNRWNKGVADSMPIFWTIITDWIHDSIENYMTKVKVISESVASMTSSFLDERIREITENNTKNLEIYMEIEKSMIELSNIKESILKI